MADISHLPSPSTSSYINNWPSTPKNNDVLCQQTCFLNHHHEPSFINNNNFLDLCRRKNCNTSRQILQGVEAEKEVSVLSVFVTVLRKYSLPRFNGFLGLPVEFEPEVPRRPPSASTRVFGVSTESMQLSFDSRGNCVPTILLMMQRCLYEQGGLQPEGIFRINPENGQEKHVRGQLNNGVIPDNIDVHCLAGLIKAWFRELPNGILDSLPPEQVMEAQSEDECARLVKLLPPTEGALLDWAINLMADVAQFEHLNKMNARNIAMVFAPNMTRMADPLTALMFAVQVMNFLKTLVEKALREREADCLVEARPMLPLDPSDQHGHYSEPITVKGANEKYEEDKINIAKEPLSNQISNSNSPAEPGTYNQTNGFLSSNGNTNAGNTPAIDPYSLGTMKDEEVDQGGNNSVGIEKNPPARRRRGKNGQPSNNRNDDKKKGSRKHSTPRLVGEADENAETKKKELNIVRCVNLHAQRLEAWR